MPVWACITLIASDISKTALRLQQRTDEDIWADLDNPAYAPFLRQPNHFQDQHDFKASWALSKLIYGNTYALKQRDASQRVAAAYVLDPTRVKALVAPNGDVYYALSQEPLSHVFEASVVVPARDIMHDLWNALYHPLQGISPIYACGLPAMQGLRIRQSSTQFFQNASLPSGVLESPMHISNETAQRLEDHWITNYSGPENVGKVAALGDGLVFKPLMPQTAHDSELSQQLTDSALEVCSAFHVPAFMVGFGPQPPYNNIEALYQLYYGQGLQPLMEKMESCLGNGLGLATDLRLNFDLDSLIRMDSTAKMKESTDGVRGGIFTPNEARKRHNLPPIEGGDTVYLQEQDHALEALAERDSGPDPFGQNKPGPAPTPAPAADEDVTDKLIAAVHVKLYGDSLAA